MAASKSNLGSFVRLVDDEVRGVTRDMRRAFNRQLHSDGVDALGYWTSADNTSGTVIDDNEGNAFVHLGFGDTTCDLLTISGGTVTKRGDSIVVTLGDEDTSTPGWNVTWTGTVTGSADADVLVPEDTTATGASAAGYSMMGIAGIISDANPPLLGGGLHGLAVATNAWWKAQAFTASASRPLTLALMQNPLSQIAVRSDYDESDVKFLLGNVFIRDKYEQLLIADKRHVNTLTLDGGWTGLDYSGKPFIVDTQCKRKRIYYIVPETMKIFRNQDFDWLKFDDGKIWHRRENKDAYFATLAHYGDLACVSRNGNGLLDDLTE